MKYPNNLPKFLYWFFNASAVLTALIAVYFTVTGVIGLTKGLGFGKTMVVPLVCFGAAVFFYFFMPLMEPLLRRGSPQCQEMLFVQKCRDANVTDVDTPLAMERARAVARSINFPSEEDDVRYMFEVVKDKEISKKRRDQKDVMTFYARDFGYSGSEKRQHMLKWSILVLRGQKDKEETRYNDGLHIITEKEIDPWIIGGAASGIAGPGAGLYAASETQRKNGEIQARNKQRREAYESLYFLRHMDASWDFDKKIEEAEKELARCPSLLTESAGPEKLAPLLHFSNARVSLLDTGNLSVSLTLGAMHTALSIGVPAVADGYVVARITQNDVPVGTATLALPWDGTDTAQTLTTYCEALPAVQPGLPFTVTPTVGSMWLIER